MPLGSLLDINISLVTNNKVNYFDVVLAEALLTLIGVGLWVLGLDLWRGRGWARKAGGASVLLVAAGYSVAWVGINYWEYTQLRAYF